MPPLPPGTIVDWFMEWPSIREVAVLGWNRVVSLHIGEKLALGVLLGVVLCGAAAAVNRILAGEFAAPRPRKSVKTPRRKKGFGLKHLALLLVALLPGGLVGTFVVYAIMGKENWRRDAFAIVGASLVPGLLLLLLRADFFPWPQARDAIYISGLLGLIFGMMQCWALVKLLREWWGEPEECVAWWPPLALWAQGALLAGCALRVLG